MDIVEKLKWRYATKVFDKKRKLSDMQISKLVECFRLSPSSYGLEPWKILIITKEEIRESLKIASFGQPQITEASHLFVLCRENKINSKYIDDYIKRVANTNNIPDISILDGHKQILNLNVVPRPDQESWMSKQLYISLGIMLTACAEMNIDSCPMEGFDAKQYSEILELEELNITPCVLLAVGYRSAEDKTMNNIKVRKETNDILVEYK